MKTILLMRHSIPEICNLPNEEIPLSVNGIGLIMNKKSSLDINQAFTSPFKRSYQTANLIHENPVIINSLKERIVGQPENDFWTKQYNDYNYKNTDGESLNEVKLRMLNAMEIVLNNTQDNETSLVVSHATAICSYLLNYCKIEVLDTSQKEYPLFCKWGFLRAHFWVFLFNHLYSTP